jgi:hypothetical protein
MESIKTQAAALQAAPLPGVKHVRKNAQTDEKTSNA